MSYEDVDLERSKRRRPRLNGRGEAREPLIAAVAMRSKGLAFQYPSGSGPENAFRRLDADASSLAIVISGWVILKGRHPSSGDPSRAEATKSCVLDLLDCVAGGPSKPSARDRSPSRDVQRIRRASSWMATMFLVELAQRFDEAEPVQAA